MSDPCHFYINIQNAHLDRVVEVLGRPDEKDLTDPKDSGAPIGLEYFTANYGFYEARLKLAAEKIPFEGWHGSGGEYADCRFCALDGVMYEAYADSINNVVVVIDEETGLPTPESLKTAQKYLEVYKKVSALFDRPEKK